MRSSWNSFVSDFAHWYPLYKGTNFMSIASDYWKKCKGAKEISFNRYTIFADDRCIDVVNQVTCSKCKVRAVKRRNVYDCDDCHRKVCSPCNCICITCNISPCTIQGECEKCFYADMPILRGEC